MGSGGVTVCVEGAVISRFWRRARQISMKFCVSPPPANFEKNFEKLWPDPSVCPFTHNKTAGSAAGPAAGPPAADYDEAHFDYYAWWREQQRQRRRRQQEEAEAEAEAEDDDESVSPAEARQLLQLPPEPAPLERPQLMRAFHRAALRSHPDKAEQNQMSVEEATTRFRRVGAARDVLLKEIMEAEE